MRYVSLFSGVEAASVAWRGLGWEPVAFAEVDPFPCAVLAYRFPDVPNLGDVAKINWKDVIDKYGAVDLVVGGSPCQSFSIAGGREGLDGESRLMYEYIRAVQEIRPTWFLWENVPGVFSTDAGRAFGILLDAMAQLRYGLAWRVLDAQFFGVAQRRRRVFLVGCSGDRGGASAAVLFDSESVRGNTQTSREKREAAAEESRQGALLDSRVDGFKFHQGSASGGIGFEEEQSPTLATDWHVPAVIKSAGFTLNHGASMGVGFQEEQAPTSTAAGNQCVVMSSGQSQATITDDGTSPTLSCLHEAPIVMDRTALNSGIGAKYWAFIGESEVMPSLTTVPGGVAHHIGTSNGDDVVGPLCARDYKGVGNEFIQEGKVIWQKPTS